MKICSFCYTDFNRRSMDLRKWYHRIWSILHLGIIKGKGCLVIVKDGKFRRTGIKVCKGFQIQIRIGERAYLDGCIFHIEGNGNEVIIGDDVALYNTEFYLRDNGSKIVIGNNVIIAGNTQIAAIEGTLIKIGDGCLFSNNISVRSGDSHKIFNQNGKRTNISKDVMIGNRVWVGYGVIILKGVNICDDCVVGSGSVVTGRFEKSNSVIAGNPACVVKEDIVWEF